MANKVNLGCHAHHVPCGKYTYFFSLGWDQVSISVVLPVIILEKDKYKLMYMYTYRLCICISVCIFYVCFCAVDKKLSICKVWGVYVATDVFSRVVVLMEGLLLKYGLDSTKYMGMYFK